MKLHHTLLIFITFYTLWAGDVYALATPTPEMQVVVNVDEYAANAIEAKTKALNVGEKKAIDILLKRMAPDRVDEVYEQVTPEQLVTMIKSFDIQQEKTIAGRYSARVNYIFDPIRTTRILKDTEGLNTLSNSTSLLVLPVLDDGLALRLWEDGNDWRKALDNAAFKYGNDQLISAYGDPKDKRLMSQETLLSGDVKKLTSLAERYGTRNVALAVARPRVREGSKVLDVFLRRAGAKQDEGRLTFKIENGETIAQMMDRAAVRVVENLSNTGDRFLLFAPEEEAINAQIIRFAFDHGRAWNRLRRTVSDLAIVEYVQIDSMSVDYALTTVYISSTPNVLRKLLLANGLQVDQQDSYWRVYRATR